MLLCPPWASLTLGRSSPHTPVLPHFSRSILPARTSCGPEAKTQGASFKPQTLYLQNWETCSTCPWGGEEGRRARRRKDGVMRPEHDTSCPATGVSTRHCSSVTVTRPPAGPPRDAGWSAKAHLGHLLLVQVEHLPGAGGSDLFVSQVARVGAVATVPSQHEDHLEERGDMQPGSWLPQPPVSGAREWQGRDPGGGTEATPFLSPGSGDRSVNRE